MFDYRALYEIQLQVSVDFLRVVQSQNHFKKLECLLIVMDDIHLAPLLITESKSKGRIITSRFCTAHSSPLYNGYQSNDIGSIGASVIHSLGQTDCSSPVNHLKAHLLRTD